MQFKSAGEAPAASYTAEQVAKVTEITTPWGNAIAVPGTFIFTNDDDDNEKFIVTDEDAHNTNLWVPA